jgi:ssDNA thymidine ADP-ribosyltransferase, DarT
MSLVTMPEALARLKFTRLTHFTPSLNLWHITREGMIRSSKDLADHAQSYFTPTDRMRFDQHPEMVCCNFEYPNPYYLSVARRQPTFVNYQGWVCLLLDARLTLRSGALFAGCNAARANGLYAREGGQALLDCFARVGKPESKYRRESSHHRGASTDLQAEALIPGPVDLSYLRGIVVPSDEDARELYGDLDRHGFNPGRFRWVVAPGFFEKNTLSNRIRFGGMISETTWTPSVDQGSS